MLPHAQVSHITSERLRVKIPSKKGDIAYFSSLKDQFSKYSGIETVEVNSVTGSVLFIHAMDIKAMADYAEENGLFKLGNLGPPSTSLSWAISESLKESDRRMKHFSGGTLDFPGLVFLGLIGAGLYQAIRGNFTPIPWYTAFWYGFGVYEFFKYRSNKNDKEE